MMTQLFTWVQGADFYRNLHAEAVGLLPKAQGYQRWIDVGCGPGLVARLAAKRGYETLGIDINPSMISAAQRIAQQEGSLANFQVGRVEDLRIMRASVISAASLLAVLPDPMVGLTALWRGVVPGGALLIVEPTTNMTPENAHQVLLNGLPTNRRLGLRLWARARKGHAVDVNLYSRLESAQVDYFPLLQGLVGAWILRKQESDSVLMQ